MSKNAICDAICEYSITRSLCFTRDCRYHKTKKKIMGENYEHVISILIMWPYNLLTFLVDHVTSNGQIDLARLITTEVVKYLLLRFVVIKSSSRETNKRRNERRRLAKKNSMAHTARFVAISGNFLKGTCNTLSMAVRSRWDLSINK